MLNLNGILTYIKNMFHTVNKEDVLKTAEFVFTNLNKDVIPAVNEMIANGDLPAIKNSNILNIIGNSSNIRYKDHKELFVKIRDILTKINANHKPFIALIQNELSDVVTDTAATPKDAAILKILNDIGAMNIFILDLSYYVIMEKDSGGISKKKIATIQDTAYDFAISLREYGKDFTKLIKDIPKVSDSIININDGKDSMLQSLIAHTGISLSLPFTKGFVNNPIYHIRMWLVDREVEKYESLKERRKLIELRLTELKLEEDGQADQGLRKQIEYYEDRLSKLDYEIDQLEQ